MQWANGESLQGESTIGSPCDSLTIQRDLFPISAPGMTTWGAVGKDALSCDGPEPLVETLQVAEMSTFPLGCFLVRARSVLTPVSVPSPVLVRPVVEKNAVMREIRVAEVVDLLIRDPFLARPTPQSARVRPAPV